MALYHQGFQPLWLWVVATLGNTAGSCVNWYVGSYALRFQDRRWFPASRQQLQRASALFRHYGSWSLLFAWLPIIGDPLTVVAGVLQVRFRVFLILVLLGKGARYAVLIWLALTLI